jgi:protein-tyrosine phosphatase
MQTPIPDSYWVVPGKLLAGEYPGSIIDSEAPGKVRSFVEMGITLFIDLTESRELKPYAHLLPETACHVRKAIRDVSIPTPELMREIQQVIAAALAAGHVVYVHCYGGIGRTGTVVGCYLVEQGMSGEEALSTIRRWRTSIPGPAVQSPETVEQRSFVENWKPSDLTPR